MSYWQLFYHFVWSTKYRAPLITAELEPILYGHIRHKAISFGGVIFALNGTADHVHLVTAVPPTIPIAKFVGQVKAVSSGRINKSNLLPHSFYWQEEYGVFSFDKKRLPNFVEYVERQKEHHAQQNLIPILERDGDNEHRGKTTSSVYTVKEASTPYRVAPHNDDWWATMLALDDEQFPPSPTGATPT